MRPESVVCFLIVVGACVAQIRPRPTPPSVASKPKNQDLRGLIPINFFDKMKKVIKDNPDFTKMFPDPEEQQFVKGPDFLRMLKKFANIFQ